MPVICSKICIFCSAWVVFSYCEALETSLQMILTFCEYYISANNHYRQIRRHYVHKLGRFC